MPFMGTDLGKIMKHEKLSEDRIQFLVYQILRGLKVGMFSVLKKVSPLVHKKFRVAPTKE